MDMMCGYSDDCAGRVIVEEGNKSKDDGVQESGSNSHDGQKILERENLDRRDETIEALRVCRTLFLNARQYKFDSESDDDYAVTYSSSNVVHVWDGWDAALIVSKRGNVKQGVTPDSYVEKVQEEDRSTEMTVNECKKQHLGKRKVRGTSKARGRDSCGKKDDFERLYNKRKKNKKCAELYSSNQPHFESDDGPLKAFAVGGMDVKAFSILREHDVGEMLQQYQRYLSLLKDCGYHFKVFLWDFDLSEAKLDIVSSPRDRSLALAEMHKYVPLKEDCKMQLTLELRRARGHHVIDSLFVEAWKCVKFEELVNLENYELFVFVRSFKGALFSLAEIKLSVSRWRDWVVLRASAYVHSCLNSAYAAFETNTVSFYVMIFLPLPQMRCGS